MKLKSLVILVFISATATAQVYEAGVFVGGSNAIADVGSNYYINPNSQAYGLVFKWNKSLRYAWRISATQTELLMQDASSSLPARSDRGLNHSTQLRDITAGLEVNYKSFELHRHNSSWTPYIFTGVSYYQFDEFYYQADLMRFEAIGLKHKIGLPLLLGVKLKIAQSIVLALESGVRYSFDDNLDGSFPVYPEYETYVFGSTSTKDWYVFSGMTITYAFGKKPCAQCYN